MRHPLLIILLALPFLALPAMAQPSEEEAGSWRLTCITDRMTDRTTCILRHRDWVERSAVGAGLTLEILEREGMLVPAVTARDLSLDSAMRGLLAFTGTAQLRFDSNTMLELPCGLEGRNLVCTPRRAEAERAAAELLTARRALVRMSGLGSNTTAATEPAELPLSQTRAATEMLRRRQPAGTAPPPEPPGFDFREWLGRLQRLVP
jgi:hypothetical protein